ncbi:Hypothetical Protein FCC1311_016622 [Hondaea fermentalgiana]|uniref:Uncharacterized protein n=1 Tax=Hondaea fermentalgiana TaxID=2315210 RepID=A0A2R5GCG1_9STRA|nr:Hypothetical Protein FCC1311_016622 [Hondaea fermentalgiana]|eukprot:GBG25444.1 Hypothetical Protein FCC1311_016622 [Hondaea fermentalgiana]
MHWYWETRSEQQDLDTLRNEIRKLDTGKLPESPEVEPSKWRVDLGILHLSPQQQQQQQQIQQQLQQQGKPKHEITSHLFRSENRAQYPGQMVLLFLKANQRKQKPGFTQDPNKNIQRYPAPENEYTIVQTTSNISLLSFYGDYPANKDYIFEGFDYVVGDFALRVGVARLHKSRSLIFVRAMFIPCKLDPDAPIYRQVEEALGLGTRFPCRAIPTRFDHYKPNIIPAQFGPMHEAIENVELLSAMRSLLTSKSR